MRSRLQITRGITWPFDGDADLVFRSAHFATYCVILSVKFKPLCIEPIMSASADKGDRKREIEQSPMKKKFRDSTISRENLDEAIANGVKGKRHRFSIFQYVLPSTSTSWYVPLPSQSVHLIALARGTTMLAFSLAPFIS